MSAMRGTFEHQIVLLVEDETFSRAMVGQMLERLGFKRVLLAQDGYQAIEILGRELVTAVITDFRMPGMHGLQLLKAIRTGKTAAPRNLPCALLTSHAERHLVGLAIVLDADTFLAKPVSSETMAKHMARCFQYRFEPLDVSSYESVEVDDAAPHLAVPLPVLDPAEDRIREDEIRIAEDEILESRPKRLADSEPRPQSPATRPSADQAPPARKPAAPVPPKPAAVPGKTASPRAAAAATAPARAKSEKKVRLTEVPEGAVLTRDVIGSSGTLMLARGTRFKDRYAKRLSELHELEGNIEYVWIEGE